MSGGFSARMKTRLPLLLVVAALCGCAAGEPGSPNPNLSAPKLVVAARADGNYTIYLHAAFGERAYDWLSLAIDNRTVANRTASYSLEEAVNGTSFFVEVGAASQGQLYEYRGHVDVLPSASGTRVRFAALSDSGAWSDPRTYNMPFAQILDHPRSG
jgi:hypothetical protein